MRHGNHSVHVIVDGQELEEYGTVRESPTRVTCWIASEEKKSFNIQWAFHKKTRSAATYIASALLTVDGIGSEGARWVLKPGGTVNISGLSSGTTLRDLTFSRVQLSDNDSLLDKEVHAEFGEIKLSLQHGNEIEYADSDSSPPPDSDDVSTPDANDQFHEKSKKTMDHCVIFGPKKKATCDMVTTERNNNPELDLVFKYRPLVILQADGIAPRPAPPDREESAHETDPVTQNDSDSLDIKLDEVDDRIKSLEDELERLRNMKAGMPVASEDRKRKRVKEGESGSRKRSIFVPREIIDLT